MACALTQGYTLDCRLNYGGVRELYVIESDNVASFTVTAGLVTAITKVTGKTFKKYNLIAHTAEIDEALVASNEMGTISIKQTVKFPINKMTIAVRNEIFLLAQNRLLFIIKDENGTNWMYGAVYGLTLTTANAKSGKLLADRNGYELSFESDEKVMAYEVQDSVLATLLT